MQQLHNLRWSIFFDFESLTEKSSEQRSHISLTKKKQNIIDFNSDLIFCTQIWSFLLYLFSYHFSHFDLYTYCSMLMLSVKHWMKSTVCLFFGIYFCSSEAKPQLNQNKQLFLYLRLLSKMYKKFIRWIRKYEVIKKKSVGLLLNK